jgi:hypothetical protein
MITPRLRIRSFASHPLEWFAFVLGARLTVPAKFEFSNLDVTAADRTPVRSLPLQTYDRKFNSQKTLNNETLQLWGIGQLNRRFGLFVQDHLIVLKKCHNRYQIKSECICSTPQSVASEGLKFIQYKWTCELLDSESAVIR